MYKFFENCAIQNEETLSKPRAEKIKASVLSRIEEDKPMKKHFGIKPLLIAAAVATTGLTTLASANTVNNGTFTADEYYGETAEPRTGIKAAEQTDKNAWEKIFNGTAADTKESITNDFSETEWQKLGASAATDTKESNTKIFSETEWQKIGEEFTPMTNDPVVYEEEIKQDGDDFWKEVTMRREDGSLLGSYRVFYVKS